MALFSAGCPASVELSDDDDDDDEAPDADNGSHYGTYGRGARASMDDGGSDSDDDGDERCGSKRRHPRAGHDSAAATNGINLGNSNNLANNKYLAMKKDLADRKNLTAAQCRTPALWVPLIERAWARRGQQHQQQLHHMQLQQFPLSESVEPVAERYQPVQQHQRHVHHSANHANAGTDVSCGDRDKGEWMCRHLNWGYPADAMRDLFGCVVETEATSPPVPLSPTDAGIMYGIVDATPAIGGGASDGRFGGHSRASLKRPQQQREHRRFHRDRVWRSLVGALTSGVCIVTASSKRAYRVDEVDDISDDGVGNADDSVASSDGDGVDRCADGIADSDHDSNDDDDDAVRMDNVHAAEKDSGDDDHGGHTYAVLAARIRTVSQRSPQHHREIGGNARDERCRTRRRPRRMVQLYNPRGSIRPLNHEATVSACAKPDCAGSSVNANGSGATSHDDCDGCDNRRRIGSTDAGGCHRPFWVPFARVCADFVKFDIGRLPLRETRGGDNGANAPMSEVWFIFRIVGHVFCICVYLLYI